MPGSGSTPLTKMATDIPLMLMRPIINYVAMNMRTLAMIVVVLPASVVLRNYLWLQQVVYDLFLSAPDKHGERIARIQADVKARLQIPQSERKLMCTARAPWANLSTRLASYKERSQKVFVGDLKDILEFDHESRTVKVEPLVEVGTVTRFLVARGFMLAVNLEIEEATVGGLAMAVGMSTHSHHVGLYQETVLEYEVVLADGRCVTASKDENADLYYALPWSHGSLALLVGLTLQVIPVKEYVKLEYRPFYQQSDYVEHIRERSLARDAEDFIEATVFSRDHAVVMTGTFVSKREALESGKVCTLGEGHQPWFWMHVKSMLTRVGGSPAEAHLKGGFVTTECVPVLQYVFRHNRGVFWALRDQMGMVPNSWWFRHTLGWMTPPKVTFLKMPATPAIRQEMMTQRVYQDIVLPISSLPEAIDRAGELFGMWPLLVYPSRIVDHGPGRRGQFPVPRPQDMVPGTNYAMYYDLGAYGIPRAVRKKQPYAAVSGMREMEDFTRSVKGAPFLYADTFMTPAEFDQTFNLDLYRKVRNEYGAEGHFMDLYDKVKPDLDWQPILEDEKMTRNTAMHKTNGHH